MRVVNALMKCRLHRMLFYRMDRDRVAVKE